MATYNKPMFSDVQTTMLVFGKTFFLRYNNIWYHLYTNIELTKI